MSVQKKREFYFSREREREREREAARKSGKSLYSFAEQQVSATPYLCLPLCEYILKNRALLFCFSVCLIRQNTEKDTYLRALLSHSIFSCDALYFICLLATYTRVLKHDSHLYKVYFHYVYFVDDKVDSYSVQDNSSCVYILAKL